MKLHQLFVFLHKLRYMGWSCIHQCYKARQGTSSNTLCFTKNILNQPFPIPSACIQCVLLPVWMLSRDNLVWTVKIYRNKLLTQDRNRVVVVLADLTINWYIDFCAIINTGSSYMSYAAVYKISNYCCRLLHNASIV